MKPAQFYLLIIVGAACLILTIVGMALRKSNQHLQAEVQQQQEEINRGNTSQQMWQTLVRDIASVAGSDSKLKDVLIRQGFTIAPAPSPASGGTSSATSSPATSGSAVP